MKKHYSIKKVVNRRILINNILRATVIIIIPYVSHALECFY